MTPQPSPAVLSEALQVLIPQHTRWAASGDDPLTGCSCYGLVRWAYRTVADVSLPEEALACESLFVRVERPYRAWDLVVARGVLTSTAHLGLLISSTIGYHCAREHQGVARFDLLHHGWQRTLRAAWRYKEWAR